jgi:hypothetical protein
MPEYTISPIGQLTNTKQSAFTPRGAIMLRFNISDGGDEPGREIDLKQAAGRCQDARHPLPIGEGWCDMIWWRQRLKKGTAIGGIFIAEVRSLRILMIFQLHRAEGAEQWNKYPA